MYTVTKQVANTSQHGLTQNLSNVWKLLKCSGCKKKINITNDQKYITMGNIVDTI